MNFENNTIYIDKTGYVFVFVILWVYVESHLAATIWAPRV